MLPSGNDAAIVVADTVGRHLIRDRENVSSNDALKAFYTEMNE